MSDAGDSHRRTKSSATSISLLRRKTGNEDDVNSDDGSPSAYGSYNNNNNNNNSGLASPPSSASMSAAAQQHPYPQHGAGAAARGHSSRLSIAGSTTMNRVPSHQSGSGSVSLSVAASKSAAGLGLGSGSGSGSSPNVMYSGASLESSVRKFRIVEALRHGDTAAISRAIRETAESNNNTNNNNNNNNNNNSNNNGPRASTSSRVSSSTQNGGGGGGGGATLEDTTILHLAIQCAEQPVVEYILADGSGAIDINARDRDGNTPLHVAAISGRSQVVRMLLEQRDINDAVANNSGRLPIDVARNPDICQQLQLSRSMFAEAKVAQVQDLIARGDFPALVEVLEEPRFKTVLDVNSTEFVTDPATAQEGGTLLHEAARRRNTQLIQLLLLHGADPFRRDRRGKLPQDITKDEVTRAMLKRSPAAVAAQRGIQEKAVLGSTTQGASTATPGDPLAGREAREMKGYLKKWTNYRKGYQLRWFVLEDGVLSYYKHQDDAGSACRGAINMRIAGLHMSPEEKTKFEIIGKSSVKYTLKANHEVEAKRWFWALNNSIQWTKDQAKEEERQRARSAELLKQARVDHSSSSATASATTIGGGGSQSELPSSSENVSLSEPKRNSSQLMRLHSATRSSVSKTAAAAAGGPGTSVAGSSIDEDEFVDAAGVERNGNGNTIHKASPIRNSIISGDGEGRDDYDDDNNAAAADNNDRDRDRDREIENDDDDADNDNDYGEESSGQDGRPAVNKDAFNITGQSARLQLDAMAHVNAALLSEAARNPSLTVSDPKMAQALATYDAAIRSLTGLVGDLLRISRDRDAYWQYRLDRESDMRRMWEESMAQVAREQEILEARVGEAEEKRRMTKRILKEAIGTGMMTPVETAAPAAATATATIPSVVVVDQGSAHAEQLLSGGDFSSLPLTMDRRRTVISQVTSMSDSESEEEDEFFDAVDAGEVKVELMLPSSELEETTSEKYQQQQQVVAVKTGAVTKDGAYDISSSFRGYENGVRSKLKIDADDRPKLSLWSILKSMIGKDMTKMTLPVTFNEPTSLLYRCCEDMEYADLLDLAAERTDSIERLIYVAAFAASEYASTIGRVAKPFNPLLGETFEYVRPDKGYRFFIEQVSHHPPIGAAWAESPRWTYWGESHVKSKFYGRSFDINPLGTWFLKLRPPSGGDNNGEEELYTWKKVTSSVVGIITGNPVVDNYGPMEVKNWNTGEVARIDFKPRGWKTSSAYQISGKVTDADGRVRVSMGGRWSSRLYARLTPGYEAVVLDETTSNTSTGPKSPLSNGEAQPQAQPHRGSITDPTRAFLIWQANPRPEGIPFNLTPFVLTFNHLDDQLRPWLAPTDSRFRPDQRAMEEGEYDFAATEKNRLEEAQRSRRRARESRGEEFVPAWFAKARCEVTGEEYWKFNGEYWRRRERAGPQGDPGVWEGLEPIFFEGGNVQGQRE